MKDRRKKEDMEKKKTNIKCHKCYTSIVWPLTMQRSLMEKSSSFLNTHVTGKHINYQRCPVETGAAHTDPSFCSNVTGSPSEGYQLLGRLTWLGVFQSGRVGPQLWSGLSESPVHTERAVSHSRHLKAFSRQRPLNATDFIPDTSQSKRSIF